jgi:hypothetical protein
MKITVIKPIFDLDQLKIPKGRQPGVIYLPADFYSFQVSLSRLGMKPKIKLLRVLMDPVGLRPHIVKTVPDHVVIEVEETAVGECGVPAEKRDPYARRQAGSIVRSKYRQMWWKPEIEILEQKSLYKLIFIDRQDEETWLYDTYTGKKILVENPIFDHKSGGAGTGRYGSAFAFNDEKDTQDK